MNRSIISEKAKIEKSVIIGPYSIIEEEVQIGAYTKIGSNVVIKKGAVIGKRNTIHAGVHISVDPQDYHFKDESSKCIIGNGNIIREYTTISRATGENNATVIGNNNFIMTYVHIAHNIQIGNNTIISSGTQLGGYVEIDDFANIGGLTGIHQFCRVGKYAMLGAMSYLNKDLPPYLLARGNRARVHGVNVKGLQRHSFSLKEIEYIKNLFRILYKSSHNLTDCLSILKKKESTNIYTQEMLKFIETSKRGILLTTSI